MSEQSGGPGWWLASDGRWYPPESAPIPPPPGAPGSPPKPAQTITIPARERIEWASFLGAVALVFGSFMTWATAGPFKVAGTDGDGWFTIIFGSIAAWLSWKRRYAGASIWAALGVLIVVWKFVDLADLADNEFWAVSPGMGLYVCGLGGAISAATSLACWRQKRS